MARAKKIKAFRPQAIIYDFDGVMTDNTVFVFSDGMEAVICNRSDGWAIDQLRKRGVHQAIISTETNPVVGMRAKKLGLPYVQGCEDKAQGIRDYAQKNNLDLKRCVYIGNDDNDLPAMMLVGYKAGPADSSPNVKKFVDWVIPVNGGKGVIRTLYHVFQQKGLI